MQYQRDIDPVASAYENYSKMRPHFGSVDAEPFDMSTPVDSESIRNYIFNTKIQLHLINPWTEEMGDRSLQQPIIRHLSVGTLTEENQYYLPVKTFQSSQNNIISGENPMVRVDSKSRSVASACFDILYVHLSQMNHQFTIKVVQMWCVES